MLNSTNYISDCNAASENGLEVTFVCFYKRNRIPKVQIRNSTKNEKTTVSVIYRLNPKDIVDNFH